MLELLYKIKEYIEETQVQIDAEWGSCRELEELIKDDSMPTIYFEIIEKIEELDE